ncbi:hypothetical protein PLESTB_001591100 [Pleodorina starrii]|uniref:Protein SirB1 N-terminal domain-containing protein n=1 Tax=Pleodorina starrii TaxID=330485 RepID=A0A9W6F8I4_9CHLO|nr:hypothetical protein PLESTB_001591100 [Pleodorina starrii]GLC66015.1 hypothetical protein PLESTF_000372700 [Pleodorina starrii]
MPLTVPQPFTRAPIWQKQRPAGGTVTPQRRARHQRPPAAPSRAHGSTSNDAPPGRRGRHPELLQLASEGSRRRSDCSGTSGREDANPASDAIDAVAEQPRPEQVDERYRRADYSDVFQFESRQSYARCISGGEPRRRLAEAALHVTAEDDAIASHSTVRFPVAAWMDRIEQLVEGICRRDVRRAAAAAAAGAEAGAMAAVAAGAGGGRRDHDTVAAEAAAVLRVAERYLFEDVGFRMPEYGRSNLPANSLVDHPGVWEDCRLGYLHETLIRRVGHPACLGLLLGEVTTRLVARGVLPCAAAIDTRSYMLLPRAVPLPTLTRELLLGSETTSGAAPWPGGSETTGGGAGSSSSSTSSGGSSLAGLNTCTSEVLVEMLRHLKRSYWPFPWDSGVDAAYPHAVGSHGGFRSAAKAAMGDDVSAALAAIGKVAAWRLERGIWTSPGAGDLRRARAACERLVLLAGDQYPEERRDLAVLLLHCGDIAAARVEMRTYLETVSGGHMTTTSASTAAAVPAAAAAVPAAADPWVGPWAPGDQPGPDPFDLVLCRRLLEGLEGASSLGLEVAGEVAGEGEVAVEPLGLEAVLRAVPPWERSVQQAGSQRYLPLTW